MSISIPTQDNPVRDFLDIEEIIEMFDPNNRSTLLSKLATFRDAKKGARRMVEGQDSITAITYICIRSNGAVELVEFNRQGEDRTLWQFTILN